MKVTKGRLKKPIALLLYGVHGVGKSTFATECEDPIFIGSEENDELDVSRLPKIKVWSELIAQLEWVKKSTHKTLVIDTIDELEVIAQNEILKNQGDKTMGNAHGGYGKAFEIMERMFIGVRESLAYLRDEKGMNIVILCHYEKTKHEDPITLTSYDTYSTSMHKKIKPIFEDWVSIIAFVNDKFMKIESSSGAETVFSDGDRVIYFEARTSHVAKNRFGLPAEREFPISGTWEFIKGHVDDFFATKKEVTKAAPKKEEAKEEKVIDASTFLDHDLIEEVKEVISRITNDKIKPKIQLSLDRADSNDELKRILTKARTLV